MNISKLEALGILNIDDSADVSEAYEEMLFMWKQKYLSTIPPIKVMKAHLLKIERFQSAGLVLLKFEEAEVGKEKLTLKGDGLLDVLINYQPILMNVKLRISNSNNASELIDALQDLIYLQDSIISKFAAYCPSLNSETFNDVKISSPSEYHKAQKELIEKDISETEIMNYLRAEIKFGSYPFNSVLLNEVIKAKKQIE